MDLVNNVKTQNENVDWMEWEQHEEEVEKYNRKMR